MHFAQSLWISLGCAVVSLTIGGSAAAEPAALVFVNGLPTPVHFNDGDSFGVLEGPLWGSKARLAGFNTLESHGPVHQWGDWHSKELYANAKMATLNARRGVWRCSSDDMSRDGFGRILFDCPDLAESQIFNGYAHAMTVTDAPANPRLLRAQHAAMRARRGMWAKGIPTYVLTSIHSADEGMGARTYNRLVNTVDGHSKKWKHQGVFRECQSVCHMPNELPLPEALAIVRDMRMDSKINGTISGIDDILVALSINTFIQNGVVPKIFKKNNERMFKYVRGLKAAGRLAGAKAVTGSCIVHVDFKRRFVQPKPKCLEW